MTILPMWIKVLRLLLDGLPDQRREAPTELPVLSITVHETRIRL
jgi:hypothetical protein